MASYGGRGAHGGRGTFTQPPGHPNPAQGGHPVQQQSLGGSQHLHPSSSRGPPGADGSFLDMDGEDESFLDMDDPDHMEGAPGGQFGTDSGPGISGQTQQHQPGSFLDMHDNDPSLHDTPVSNNSSQIHPSAHSKANNGPVAGGSNFPGAYGEHDTTMHEHPEESTGFEEEDDGTYGHDDSEETPFSPTTMVDPENMGYDDDEETVAGGQGSMARLGYSSAFHNMDGYQGELDDEGYQ